MSYLRGWWKKSGSFKGEYFDGWLFRIASNIFHDHLRERQRQKKLLEKHREQFEEAGTRKLCRMRREDIDKLQKKLGQLDDETRELIMLRFYSDMSFKEIAEMRGEPIGTTLSKVHRGLEKIARADGVKTVNNRKDKNFDELLKRFYGDETQKRSAEDIAKGERILREYPDPKPDEETIILLKAKVAKAVAANRERALRRTYYRVAAFAAAVIMIAFISVQLLEKRPIESRQVATTVKVTARCFAK